MIVFEDLVELGFETFSNRTSNMEEVRAAMLKVAKLHAVSYKMAQEVGIGYKIQKIRDILYPH